MFWLDTAARLSAARLATPMMPRFSLSSAEIVRLWVWQPNRPVPKAPIAVCLRKLRRFMEIGGTERQGSSQCKCNVGLEAQNCIGQKREETNVPFCRLREYKSEGLICFRLI